MALGVASYSLYYYSLVPRRATLKTMGWPEYETSIYTYDDINQSRCVHEQFAVGTELTVTDQISQSMGVASNARWPCHTIRGTHLSDFFHRFRLIRYAIRVAQMQTPTTEHRGTEPIALPLAHALGVITCGFQPRLKTILNKIIDSV